MPPQIADTARRVARTAVQAALAFLTFAAVYPLLVTAIGAPTGSRTAVWLAAAGVWVTTAAGIISRIMAIPAVNAAIARIRLDGHSGTTVVDGTVEDDRDPTWTQMVAVQTKDTGEFNGDPAH